MRTAPASYIALALGFTLASSDTLAVARTPKLAAVPMDRSAQPVTAPPISFVPGARPPRGFYGAHGSVVWSVVLAAAPSATPELHALHTFAVQRLRLAASLGEANCSRPVQGAYPATLGATHVSVQFRSERDARRFAGALAQPALWVGRVRVYCAD